MPHKLCLDCGAITKGSRCNKHQREYERRKHLKRKASGKRTGSTSIYRRERKRAMDRAQNMCEYIDNGVRCEATASLEAHHINGDHHDHRVNNLAILCHDHHMMVEAQRKRK